MLLDVSASLRAAADADHPQKLIDVCHVKRCLYQTQHSVTRDIKH